MATSQPTHFGTEPISPADPAASCATAEQVASAIESGRFGIVLLGQDGRVLHANRPACELLGHRSRTLLGAAMTELVDPGDRGWVETQLELLLAGAIEQLRGDVGLLMEGGPAIRAELHARAITDQLSPTVRAVVVLVTPATGPDASRS